MKYDFANETIAERRLILAEWLSLGECVVTFTKVDGTLREMPCTLKADMLPPPVLGEGRKQNPDVMRAWLIDKQEWRSFRLDNVISVSQS